MRGTALHLTPNFHRELEEATVCSRRREEAENVETRSIRLLTSAATIAGGKCGLTVAPRLLSTVAVVRPRAVRSTSPAVMSAHNAERQRRSISQPRVARVSGLPWDRTPHVLSTLKGLHLSASPSSDCTDATLSGLAGLGRALTQGRRLRANPGLYDGIPLGFTNESASKVMRFTRGAGWSWPVRTILPASDCGSAGVR